MSRTLELAILNVWKELARDALDLCIRVAIDQDDKQLATNLLQATKRLDGATNLLLNGGVPLSIALHNLHQACNVGADQDLDPAMLALDLMEIVAAALDHVESVKPDDYTSQPGARIRIQRSGKAVMVDGERIEVRSEPLLKFYQAIVDAKGEYVTARTFELPLNLNPKELPEKLSQTVESKKGHGGGYRLRPEFLPPSDL